jgi:WD40 repeat protein
MMAAATKEYYGSSRQAPYLAAQPDGSEDIAGDTRSTIQLASSLSVRFAGSSHNLLASTPSSSSYHHHHHHAVGQGQSAAAAAAAAGAEADAAGGFTQRVSSLNLSRLNANHGIPRTQSVELHHGATAQARSDTAVSARRNLLFPEATRAGTGSRQGSYMYHDKSSGNLAATTAAAAASTSATGGPDTAKSAATAFLSHLHSPPRKQSQQQIRQQQIISNNVNTAAIITPDWRLRDRMKTVGVGLILALNVGTDPPDVTKPSPCATLQCWMDPFCCSRAKAKEWIGERLEQQYAKWQLAKTARPLKYRRALDPTVEDVRTLCMNLRRQARTERVLLHYNGHGVPRPTENGEIWVFDKNHTEYIPLSIIDLRQWLGKPSLVVLDCSSAGMLLPFFTTPLHDDSPGGSVGSPSNDLNKSRDNMNSSMNMSADDNDPASRSVRDTIVLCPCSEGEWLPMHPDYPADIFTSCLTTPIPMALRWFVRRNPASMQGLNPDAVDAIPGKASDRKTPLGELNWIFTAVTDSIAWNVLPKPLFQRLFRQDLMVASMFRNFLLADRILRSLDCTPVSHPPLPVGVADHPLWQAWDLACETLIFQLLKDGSLGNHVMAATNKKIPKNPASVSSPGIDRNESDDAEESVEAESSTMNVPLPLPAVPVAMSSSGFISSPFFSEQLTAFEVWLEFAEIHKMQLSTGRLESPEQLPIVLQVLLSQVHRIRALRLLRRFLDLGPWAVNLSLSLGIFPYVMKLLQSPEYKSLLVSIWASVLTFDPSCRVDLLKDGAFEHFVQHLTYGFDDTTVVNVAQAAKERTMAGFVLAAACHEYPAGQAECVRLKLHSTCCVLLSSYEDGDNVNSDVVELHHPAHFRLWVCLCLGNMVKDNVSTQDEAYSAGVHSRLFIRLNDKNADVRAAVCYALGCLIGSTAKKEASRQNPSQQYQQQQQQQFQQQQQQYQPGPPQQQTVSFQGSPALVPQRLQLAGNMVLPGGAATTTGAPGQLQPNFSSGGVPNQSNFSSGGVPNLQWRPQQMQGMPGGQQQMQSMPGGHQQMQSMPGGQPIYLPQGQQMPVLNQSMPTPLRAPNDQSMQGQYMVHGQPMQAPHPQMGVPTGFFLGNSVGGQGQPGFMNAPRLQQQMPLEPRQPTAFEDRRRLELDLSVMEVLLKATADGSVVVRYEATIALASAIGKYLDGFLVAADELAASPSSSPIVKIRKSIVRIPRGLERNSMDRFGTVWKALRSLQHDDPFPSISKAANDVVSVVHEHLLHLRMDSANREREQQEEDLMKHTHNLGMGLTGIDEEVGSAAPESGLPRSPASSVSLVKPVPQSAAQAQRAPKAELRRVVSEFVPDHSGVRSMEENALLSQPEARPLLNYSLPKSKYYDWKKNAFDTNFEASDEGNGVDLDPLSPAGAAQAYQDRRSFHVEEGGQELATRYASLAPKPPKPKVKSIYMLLEEEDEAVLMAAEEESAGKKKELELKEKKLLRDTGVKMTSMLNFHSYEDVIMACGVEDRASMISMWSTENGTQLTKFANGNPKGSRMTTSTWINEDTQGKFLVGTDDGTVRIWSDLLEANGEACLKQPTLVSAFNAVPMTAGDRGSGLVCDWQPFSGTLLAGGNSKFIRCWDLEAEKQVCQLETNTAGYVTTLTTAWDYDSLGMGPTPQGYQGIGRDIVVAGHSDGTLKIFDVRAPNAVSEMRGRSPPRVRRQGPVQYSEHKSWVVATAFTGHGSRYELMSGTIGGDIKAWDLRMSSSIRTMEVQRSTMTALAVHSKIPMIATGSSAQFIKVLTMDGDTMQVLRYHGTGATHRVGPVSCLAFHRFKPLLAAGATDAFIGLYAPKKSII